MTDTVLVQNHEGWVEITFNRPDRLNSFTDEMHLALRDALETARDTGARALLLTGAGRGFCTKSPPCSGQQERSCTGVAGRFQCIT